MPNLNKVQLMGNLTRDPETRELKTGAKVTEFALAINRKWRDEGGTDHEETTFVEITFWGPRGAAISKYTRKGHPLYIEGRLQLDTWEDKETGQQRSRLRVIGDGFQFLGSGKKKTEGGGEGEKDDLPY